MITTLFCIAALSYAAACGALYVFQRRFVFYPQPAAVQTPLMRVNSDADAMAVVASTRVRAGAQAVVYFGGNGEDVSMSLGPLAEAFPEHALYLLHYRGYGSSGGEASEDAIAHDALALFDRVHAQHANVTVIGRSLGTGVAMRLASQRPVARLVLVTPYDSLQELAVRQFPYFPVRWLLKDKFESWRYVAQVQAHVQAPTLLLVAENDQVIPRASSEQLFKRFGDGKATRELILGASHNDISLHPSYPRLLSGTP
ncbi:MAG: alpha/beta fold hydrolase [Rhizobacter sp.]